MLNQYTFRSDVVPPPQPLIATCCTAIFLGQAGPVLAQSPATPAGVNPSMRLMRQYLPYAGGANGTRPMVEPGANPAKPHQVAYHQRTVCIDSAKALNGAFMQLLRKDLSLVGNPKNYLYRVYDKLLPAHQTTSAVTISYPVFINQPLPQSRSITRPSSVLKLENHIMRITPPASWSLLRSHLSLGKKDPAPVNKPDDLITTKIMKPNWVVADYHKHYWFPKYSSNRVGEHVGKATSYVYQTTKAHPYASAAAIATLGAVTYGAGPAIMSGGVAAYYWAHKKMQKAELAYHFGRPMNVQDNPDTGVKITRKFIHLRIM